MAKRVDITPPVRSQPCPHPEVRAIAIDLQAIERRLYDLGLQTTARAVNEATKALGWDAAREQEARTGVAAKERAAMRRLFHRRVQP